MLRIVISSFCFIGLCAIPGCRKCSNTEPEKVIGADTCTYEYADLAKPYDKDSTFDCSDVYFRVYFCPPWPKQNGFTKSALFELRKASQFYYTSVSIKNISGRSDTMYIKTLTVEGYNSILAQFINMNVERIYTPEYLNRINDPFVIVVESNSKSNYSFVHPVLNEHLLEHYPLEERANYLLFNNFIAILHEILINEFNVDIYNIFEFTVFQ